MDNGLQDLIDELREYGIARKGELAGMVLEAANRLEELAEERDQMVAFIDRTNERLNTIVEIQGSWLRRQKGSEATSGESYEGEFEAMEHNGRMDAVESEEQA